MNQWELITEARSRLLKGWLILGGLLGCFLFLQHLFGKIEGIEQTVWSWFSACILPGAILLIAHLWRNRHTTKMVPLSILRVFYILTLFYFIALFFTFFASQAAIQNNEYSLEQYFKQSFMYLMPINVLIILGLIILFYIKNNIIKPTGSEINTLALNKAQKADSYAKKNQKECFDLIAASELRIVFDKLETQLIGKDQEALQQLVLLKFQFSYILKEEEQGTISEADALLVRNRVAVGLIDLTGRI